MKPQETARRRSTNNTLEATSNEKNNTETKFRVGVDFQNFLSKKCGYESFSDGDSIYITTNKISEKSEQENLKCYTLREK